MSDGYITMGVHDPFRQQCYVTGTNNGKSAEPKNQKTEKSKPTADPPAEQKSWWKPLLFGGLTGGLLSLFGCGGESKPTAEEILKGDGVSMLPNTNSEENKGEETTEFPSGAIIFHNGKPSDGFVILPTENGNVVLPDDIWFEVTGQGTFFQETPWILLESGVIMGQNIANLKLHIEIGTDSTKIKIQDKPDLAIGCYNGLINVKQLSPEDLKQGEVGCPEEGYKSFVACPSDPGNRLPLYLAGYILGGYRYDSETGKYKLIAKIENTFLTDIEDLYNYDPNNPGNQTVTPTGVFCGENPNPLKIEIPDTLKDGNRLYLAMKLKKIVDARQADKAGEYKTILGVKIKGE